MALTATLHTKSDGGRQWIGMGVLVSRISSPVVRSKGLLSKDPVLEGTTSEALVVFERHADDDGDPSWTMDFFYPVRSCTIPAVV